MRMRHLLLTTGALLVLALIMPAPADAAAPSGLTPIVLFPAFHLTRLRVAVHNQLRYDFGSRKPMAERFHEQPGVTASVADYGSTASAPLYEPMYRALEAAGYTRNRNVRVAGYDARLTPDQGGFLGRTIRLIEQTSRENGRIATSKASRR